MADGPLTPDPTVFVLYGATGDLAHRLVLPAFFQPVLHDPLGHRILLIALGLELLGALLLYRLAKSL